MHKAQKLMVRDLIVKYMSDKCPDQEWQRHYDKQAIMRTNYVAKTAGASQAGNKKQFNHVLNYYRQEYGLPASSICSAHLSPKYQAMLNEMTQRVSPQLPKTAEEGQKIAQMYARAIENPRSLATKDYKDYIAVLNQFNTISTQLEEIKQKYESVSDYANAREVKKHVQSQQMYAAQKTKSR